MKEKASTSSIGAAAFLALLTLFVFFTLRNNGPESTVRRFHEAIVRNNRAELEQVADGALDSLAGRRLLSEVGGLLFTGSRYQVLGQSPYPGVVPVGRQAVITEVIYRRPDGIRIPMLYVVSKENGQSRWRVDVQGTYYLFVRAFGLG